MANHIIITKLTNGNVQVDNSQTNKPRGLRATLSPYSSLSNNDVHLTNHNEVVVESFNPDNVEKVIRADGTEIVINDQATLFNELNTYFFFEPVGSGAGGFNYLGEFANFTDLDTSQPAGISGRFAYVIASQGTQWLPGGMGGSYYNKGWYYDNGTNWSDDKDEIAKGLDDLEKTKLDSVVAGAGVSVDDSDPVNPIVSTTVVPSGVSQDYVRVTNVASQPINPTGATNLTYDTTDKNSNATLYTVGGGVITINETGRYRVKSETSITSVSTQRADPKVKMLVNGVAVQDSLGRDIVGYGLYARNSGLIEDSSHGWEYVLDLTAGDTVQGCLLRNNIDLNGVSTIPDGTYLEIFRMETAAAVGGGVSLLFSSLMGAASSTTGLFTKASTKGQNGTNPSGMAITSPFDQYANGNIDPYILPNGGVVIRATLVLSAAAVSTGTVTGDPDCKFRLYSISKNSRAAFVPTSDIDIPLPNALVGIFNNLASTPSLITVDYMLPVPITIPDDTLFGWEFVNQSGNTVISGIAIAELTLTLQ